MFLKKDLLKYVDYDLIMITSNYVSVGFETFQDRNINIYRCLCIICGYT